MRLTVNTDKKRLDAYLAGEKPEYSRSFWQKLCDDGRVKVNGKIAGDKQILKAGDVIDYDLPATLDFTSEELPVIYQDDDVIVINKPAGLLTHAKGVLSDEFSIAEYMRGRTTDGTQTNRPGIVHRLDRATSGVIIAAKNSEAKHWLQKQFSTRKVKKTYLALVKGHLDEPAAIIRLPIERNPKHPQTFKVSGNGKSAETTYETVATHKDATLLRLQPQTGRTHQLRVHLAHLGHPIIGDELYGTTDKKLGRMFLHASELELTLPSRERKTFTAPLPQDLQTYLDSLQ